MDSQGKGKKRSVGWFPASYVKLLESRKEEDSAAGPAQAVASGEFFFISWRILLNTYVSGVRSTSFKCAMSSSFCDPSLDNFQLTKGGERYVAMFPYTGQYEDELSFEVIKKNSHIVALCPVLF